MMTYTELLSRRLPGLLFFALAGALTACQKNSDGPATPTAQQLLTGTRWREIGHSKNPLSVGNKAGGNLYDLDPACRHDNFVTFSSTSASSLMTIDEGDTKCAATDPQTQAVPWYFHNGTSQLLLSLPCAPPALRNQAYLFDIVTLSASALALKRTINDAQGQTVEEVTFAAF